MSQSFVQIYVHIVFRTKNSVHFISEEIEEELYSYIGGILRNYSSISIQIGGMSEHVHLLCTLPKTMTLPKLIEEVKKSSSKWMKTKGSKYEKFFWQDGYGGFSVSSSKVETLKKYILNQKEHHKKMSFIEEYKQFLDEYGIEYDDKYI